MDFIISAQEKEQYYAEKSNFKMAVVKYDKQIQELITQEETNELQIK